MTERYSARERVPVPMLPGMRVHDPRAFAKFKPQTLRVENGVSGVFDEQSRIPMPSRPSTASERGRDAGEWEEADENLRSMANMSLNTTRRGRGAAAAGEGRGSGSVPVLSCGDARLMERPATARLRRRLEEDGDTEVYRPSSAAYGAHTGARPLQPTTQEAWVAHDSKVLRFFAYFEEEVGMSEHDKKRVRKVVIMYYLEDGSIQVSEPRESNSGLHQGVFLKRMRVPCDRPSGRSKFVTLDSLAIGASVRMFARAYHVVAVDAFTRSFLQREGRDVPADRAYPTETDTLRIYMARDESAPTAVLPRPPKSSVYLEEMEKLRKFMQHDRQVLRFFAVHDTRAEDPVGGEKRGYILHYYLVDDTVEILEVVERNSGRDPFPKFLNRCHLPKEVYSIGARPMSDATKKRMAAQRVLYTYPDLRIGEYINCYNRQLLLRDCDEFTRRFYIDRVGFSEADFAPVSADDELPAAPVLPPPPHNGFGSEEDSQLNCYHLRPKTPLKDVKHFEQHDGKVLRFEAVFLDDPAYPVKCEVDAKRQFVVTFYVVDGTLNIFEPPQRNSGIQGRKYLERCRVKKPSAQSYYEMRDMFVGSRLLIHSRLFLLTDADAHTLNFMASNANVFWRSDPQRVIGLVQADLRIPMDESAGERLRDMLIDEDRQGTGSLALHQLENVLTRAGCQIGPQEVITLGNFCNSGRSDSDDRATVKIEQVLKSLGVH